MRARRARRLPGRSRRRQSGSVEPSSVHLVGPASGCHPAQPRRGPGVSRDACARRPSSVCSRWPVPRRHPPPRRPHRRSSHPRLRNFRAPRSPPSSFTGRSSRSRLPRWTRSAVGTMPWRRRTRRSGPAWMRDPRVRRAPRRHRLEWVAGTAGVEGSVRNLPRTVPMREPARRQRHPGLSRDRGAGPHRGPASAGTGDRLGLPRGAVRPAASVRQPGRRGRGQTLALTSAATSLRLIERQRRPLNRGEPAVSSPPTVGKHSSVTTPASVPSPPPRRAFFCPRLPPSGGALIAWE